MSNDPARPKAPGLASWTEYQTRRAAWPDIVKWITAGHQLAVVTGRVSGVVVVDFDDMALWQRFAASPVAALLGQMAAVRTQRGVHLYLYIPAHGAAIRGRSGPGWDLKAAGGYVVAPSAHINGHRYSMMTGDVAVLGLPNEDALNAVLAWLDSEPPAAPSAVGRPADTPAAADGPAGERLPVEAARAMYRTWASAGRNNALYAAARLLHDHYYSEDAAIAALADLHVAAPSVSSEKYESASSRQREALATIHSAYSRARRPTRPVAIRQLPNAIREALNRAGLTCVARVLDALRTAGYGPGCEMSQREMGRAVSGIVGGHSVRRAAAWLRRAAAAPPKTPRDADALRHGYRQGQDTNEICIGNQNRQKRFSVTKGRPKAPVTLPTDEALAVALGCQCSRASDVVAADEQKTVKTYRAALHREFIKRRPGAYGIRWLAHRVGKSKPTVRRYNKLTQIIVEPRAQREVLTRALLARLPEDGGHADLWRNKAGRVRTPGYWLEDDAGQRYPALRVVAKILTRGRRAAWLCVQGVNHYHHASQPEHTSRPLTQQPMASLLAPVPDDEAFLQMASKRPMSVAEKASAAPHTPQLRMHKEASSATADTTTKRQRKWERKIPVHNRRAYRRAMADPRHEYVAQRIHEAYPGIALSTARRVMHLCGGQAVYGAMAVVADRQRKGRDVRDAARLFLTIAGYSTAVRKQQEEKKQYQYRVVLPRRVARAARKWSLR